MVLLRANYKGILGRVSREGGLGLVLARVSMEWDFALKFHAWRGLFFMCATPPSIARYLEYVSYRGNGESKPTLRVERKRGAVVRSTDSVRRFCSNHLFVMDFLVTDLRNSTIRVVG